MRLPRSAVTQLLLQVVPVGFSYKWDVGTSLASAFHLRLMATLEPGPASSPPIGQPQPPRRGSHATRRSALNSGSPRCPSGPGSRSSASPRTADREAEGSSAASPGEAVARKNDPLVAADSDRKTTGAGATVAPVARWKKPTARERRAESRRAQEQIAAGGGTATLTAINIQQWIFENVPLRFAPPRREEGSDPAAFDYWWSHLQYAFEDLRDPTAFPPFSDGAFNDAERRTLNRFVVTARDLARSTVINGQVSMTGRYQADRVLEAETQLPPRDAISGFAAIFRQVYSPEEPASFAKVMALLMNAARETADGNADERLTLLRSWGRAVGVLRNKTLELLLLERLAKEGKWPRLTDEDQALPRTPEQLISDYYYGDHIHWADKAALVEQREQLPFLDAWHRFTFIESAIALSHLYIGFSVLIEAARPDEPPRMGGS
jgi:hypothetical protein